MLPDGTPLRTICPISMRPIALILATSGLICAAAAAQTPNVAPDTAPAAPGAHPTAARVSQEEQSAAHAQATLDAASGADLWQRIRKGFVLEELKTPLVAEHEAWYASRPDYIQRFIDRGARYLYHVVEEVEKRGMPMEIALLPVIESAFNPQAYSRAKAAGMWQFIPSTGKNFGLKQDWLADNRRDVLLSTHAAMDYLQKLHGMFNSWELALAAYNCGEGCVGRAIQKNAKKGLPGDFLSLNLPNETRHYVPKLIAVKNIILSPGDYGIDLTPVQNRPYFERVDAPERMDAKLAARLAEMPEDEFAALNPASTRPVVTHATGGFLVPSEKAAVFRENLELYRSVQGPFVSWKMVQAKRGESLDGIAKRHGMTASYLRATSGPFKEKGGKLTQAATFMVPMTKEAKNIDTALEQKVALKAAKSDGSAAADNSAPAATAQASEPAAPAAAASVPSAAISIAPIPSALSVHIVSRGDTLYSVARLYGTTVEDIQARNQLAHANLRAGQKLTVAGTLPPPLPGLIPVSAPEPEPATARNARGSRASTQIHTIKSGDTLFGIANRYGVQLADLMRWNKLTPRSVIRPGTRIKLQA
ncbi:MAG: LysM peptidoglycan-binding domain-containing protein [Betaproteobacteria bacterium]|nr:LysM peptidoglycan-binding domain-containing protein [Betaproteobacteria bacterium]